VSYEKAGGRNEFPQHIKDKLKNRTFEEYLSTEGVLCSNLIEPVPNYRKAPCETIVSEGSAKNNQWIVMGRDRPSSLSSGYGGMGHAKCGTIDIVVGRSFQDLPTHEPESGDPNYIENDFRKDAARIYISQKTDIDRNFSLKKGGVGFSDGKSAIGIKADAVRIIGREGIKLVTATDDYNSVGGGVTRVKGIDLMAGNRSYSLQPLVKGNYLLACLKEMQQHVGELAGSIDSLAQKQIALDAVLAAHVHPTAAGPTLPSVELAAAASADAIAIAATDIPTHMNIMVNQTYTDMDYLTRGGAKYILSSYNKTN